MKNIIMIKKQLIYLLMIVLLLSGLFLTGCKKAPPEHVENICSIFHQYPKWYWAAQDVQKHWGVPIDVLMAIIYQESRFNSTAKPPREKLLWVIPWFRPTSAYGYSQALKNTWHNYKKSTHHRFASRDAFNDAADFIGWYADQAHKKAGVSKHNAYQLYLAYHEGIGGYQHKTYLRKKWLISVAWHVQIRAQIYYSQLRQCGASLKKKHFWNIW